MKVWERMKKEKKKEKGKEEMGLVYSGSQPRVWCNGA